MKYINQKNLEQQIKDLAIYESNMKARNAELKRIEQEMIKAAADLIEEVKEWG